MKEVILVNEFDQPLGVLEKLEAHQKGLLHRAFSIFIFNDENELMLQRRAFDKYHSGGLWTNTCCSHPDPNETVEVACHRRLKEEMGFDTALEFVTSFIYKAELDQQLTEHEFDHVYIGKYNDRPVINESEVSEWKFVNLTDLENDMKMNPDHYTVWFKIIFSKVKNHLLSQTQR
ncbi:MAG: isopentenyl-diphosphate Delta-isomerase [Crocinitomicaceae bacterium]|nr:isopentenyl-diphosphate Delta-isomerase [Crocinitomicaceae bacterium]MBK9592002.1 isopentenyl-diphosphate Delta-isomerase [Crocinitomicaceae bacterium]